MSTNVQVPASKSKPVVLMASVLAGLNVILGGSALADVGVDQKWIALANLVVAAVAIAYGVYTTGIVTPWSDVAAKVDPSTGQLVAGPAASQATGTPVTTSRLVGGRNDRGAVDSRSIGILGLIVAAVGVVLLAFEVEVVGGLFLVAGLALCVVAVLLIIIQSGRRTRL